MANLSGLYVITDPFLCRQNQRSLIDAVREALIGGARLVQYRNKLATPAEQREEAKALRALTHKHDALLLINDSVELCLAVDADGVHLGQKDGQIGLARQLLGDRILGITCHDSLANAHQAVREGADYCAFGAVYPSITKPDASSCSLATIKEASKLPIPICAIGGISVENAAAVKNEGADMLAVISGVFGTPSIRASAQALASLF